MPQHIQAGYTLDHNDLLSIKKSLERRDRHLKRLYAREIAQAQTINTLKDDLSRSRKNFRLNIYGYADQLSINPLPFSDGWISGNLNLEIAALEDIRQIQINTVVPDSAHYHQEISVLINGTLHSIVHKQENVSTIIKLSPRVEKKAKLIMSMTGSVAGSGKEFGLNEDQRKISFRIKSVFLR